MHVIGLQTCIMLRVIKERKTFKSSWINISFLEPFCFPRRKCSWCVRLAGPGRVAVCGRSAPGRPGEPSQQGPGPAVAAPKQALVWIYSSSVRPLTNQYKLTLVTCAHWWTPCVRTNSALHKTILSKLLVSYTSAKKELFGPLLAITVLNLS